MNARTNSYPKLSTISGLPLTPRRILSAAGLIFFILIYAELGRAYNLEIWFMLPVLVAGYVLLCVNSVPVAAAQERDHRQSYLGPFADDHPLDVVDDPVGNGFGGVQEFPPSATEGL